MGKRGLEAIIHLLFWLSTAWLIATSFSIQSHEVELINGNETIRLVRNKGLAYQLLLYIVLSCIIFYLNSWQIFKKLRDGKTNSALWHGALFFGILSAVTYFVSEIRLLDYGPRIPKQIAFGVVVFYFSISVAYALVKASIDNNQRHQQLILDKKQTELSLLRNQLQPHFLFNALNNLYSMVDPVENPKLVSAFDKLSSLLRFVVEENKAKKIPVSQEIEFLKNYLDLQMLRFEENEVNVEFKVEGTHDHQEIEPGLFIPFVENAFKYGTEPEKYSKIEILFDLSEVNRIRFSVENKAMLTYNVGAGTGIKTTKRRLNLIYPDKHELTISDADHFTVDLTIVTQ